MLHKMEKGKNELSGGEAIFAFIGYLTTRPGTLKIGAGHECKTIVDMAARFIESNNMDMPREDWAKNIKHPV